MSVYNDRLSGFSSSLAVKAPVRVATTASITLSGMQTIDGELPTVTQHESERRVLVKNQTDAAENGIYVMDTGPWERAKDFDGTNDFRQGTRVQVSRGTVGQGEYIVTSEMDPLAFVVGTDTITFTAAASLDFLSDPLYISDGTAAAPGLAFGSDTDTGLYRIGADTLGFAAGGVGELRLDGSALAPVTSRGLALGTAVLMFAGLFLGATDAINWNNGDVLLTHSADTLTLTGGTLVLPASGLQIGASNPFSDGAGTLTLQNVDALDTATENTIEAAIDTLANLTSIQGQTFTLAGAFITSGANSLTLTTSGATNVTLPTTGTLATLAGVETLSNKVLTLPQINDTSADHQYVLAVSELAADRTVTLPLLTGNDTFVFVDFAATFTNKTISLANNTLTGTTAEFNAALSDGNFATLAQDANFNTLTVNTNLVPDANDGAALGTTALQFSDLFLAEGAVINWDNGDVTITQTGNVLSFAGASTRYEFDANLTPLASDGAALGTTALMFSDLFLASGAAINWNNGDVTLTHSADTLTFGGGVSLAGVVNFSATGYADLAEIALPSNPAADVARFYAKDNGSGTTKLYFLDSAGTETEIGSGGGGASAATQAEQEAASSTSVFTSPGRQHFHPGHFKAGASINGTGTPAVVRGWNTTSITDNGTGDYTFNWGITLSATTASFLASANPVGNIATTVARPETQNSGAAIAVLTTATTSTRVTSGDAGASFRDPTSLHMWLIGDI